MSVSTRPQSSGPSQQKPRPDISANETDSVKSNFGWSREISQEQLEFERLVLEVAARLVEGDVEHVNESITTALVGISELLGSELTTFLQRDRSTGILKHTHQWVASDSSFLLDFTSQKDFDIETDAPWVSSELAKGESIVINCLDDFPPGAAAEKLICQNTGIKSIVWVPVTVAGTVVACIVFNSLRQGVCWPGHLIMRLQLFGEIIVNAVRRVQSGKELRDSLAFEQLLAQLSRTFVALPSGKIDGAINDALRTIGEFMGVDRVFVDQFSYDKSEFRLTHMWSIPGIPRDELAFEVVLSKDLPWYTNTILSGQPVVFVSPDELPAEAAEERRYVKEAGIKSSAIVPLMVDQSVIGNFGFDMIRCETEWSKTFLRQLRLASEIIANALKRRQMEQELQNTYEEVRLLKERLQAENIYLRKEVNTQRTHAKILGHSDAIKSVLNEIGLVSGTDATVLISGETGVGKELIAHAIHERSPRGEKTLLKVNCAALPASLIEAELFGREKGAYTGALTKQVGRFELADGSTIFLDEISELPFDLQAKLLRVLQEGEFERLGSSKTVKVDVRVIAATNQDLETALRDGRFRQDLYYRLNVFPIVVPPLRDRPGDIPVLVWEFVQEFGKKMGKTIETIDDSSMQVLQDYDWPGNVRELRNLVERAMILSRERALQIDLPRQDEARATSILTLRALEEQHIERALQQTGWRISGKRGAAELLGLKPTTLRSRMDKLGIRRPTP